MRRVAGVLLAAGSSRRFGANKLLAPLADGTPVAVMAARRLIAAVPNALAVVRPGDDVLAALLVEQGLQVVECTDASLGMGHSLAAGVAAADGADAWLVALADMPCIKHSTLTGLIALLNAGARLAAPFHNGQRGHPVGFAAGFRDELLALTGDAGARAVLGCHAQMLAHLDVEDPGVLADVDTPADLAGLSMDLPVL